MISTFDFVLRTQYENEINNQLAMALSSENDSILNICNVELTFKAKDKTIRIDRPKEKGLDCKLVPAIIRYDVLEKMMNGNWEDFSEEDIEFLSLE